MPAQHSPDSSQRLTDPSAARDPARRGLRWTDGDVLVALVVLWIASLVRVWGAFARHEVFGSEATLAFMSLVLVPCLFLRARVRPRAPAVQSVTRPQLRLVGARPSSRPRSSADSSASLHASASANLGASPNARRRNAEDAEGREDAET